MWAIGRTVIAVTLMLIAGRHALADEAAVPALVTVLTAEHPETQLMAMTLTLQAINQGSTARVLLCGPAGDMALRQPPASATQPQKPANVSPRQLLDKIIASGAPVEVCAIYLPNRSLDAAALADGIRAARPDAMAGHLLAPNTRILSF